MDTWTKTRGPLELNFDPCPSGEQQNQPTKHSPSPLPAASAACAALSALSANPPVAHGQSASRSTSAREAHKSGGLPRAKLQKDQPSREKTRGQGGITLKKRGCQMTGEKTTPESRGVHSRYETSRKKCAWLWSVLSGVSNSFEWLDFGPLLRAL